MITLSDITPPNSSMPNPFYLLKKPRKPPTNVKPHNFIELTPDREAKLKNAKRVAGKKHYYANKHKILERKKNKALLDKQL